MKLRNLYFDSNARNSLDGEGGERHRCRCCNCNILLTACCYSKTVLVPGVGARCFEQQQLLGTAVSTMQSQEIRQCSAFSKRTADVNIL